MVEQPLVGELGVRAHFGAVKIENVAVQLEAFNFFVELALVAHVEVLLLLRLHQIEKDQFLVHGEDVGLAAHHSYLADLRTRHLLDLEQVAEHVVYDNHASNRAEHYLVELHPH